MRISAFGSRWEREEREDGERWRKRKEKKKYSRALLARSLRT
jgi:hypothetical protein